MTELLKIDDLTVSFGTSAGRVKALNNVSLSLDEGEVYCMVGESGAGKSTLALSVMGLLPHNSEVSDAAFPHHANMPAGSDAHKVEQIGTVATEFQRPISCLNDLIRELQGGRYSPVDLREKAAPRS